MFKRHPESPFAKTLPMDYGVRGLLSNVFSLSWPIIMNYNGVKLFNFVA